MMHMRVARHEYAMPLDMTVELIGATVELEQPLGNGLKTVGAGFLVADPGPDGAPRVVLVTANHVLNRMKSDEATVGWRIQGADGSWRYAPAKITIRDHGAPLWVHHGSRDIAAIPVNAPPQFARAALPLSMFGGEEEADDDIGPGDEMMVLGFPEGYSSNAAGFPILRSGNVASYPNAPATAYPTFLLDFHVFPGNSGGPVYVQPAGQLSGHVAGVLTQEVEPNGENLGIGIVTKARFVRETLALLDEAPKPAPTAPPEGPAARSVDTVDDEPPAAAPSPAPAPAKSNAHAKPRRTATHRGVNAES